MLIQVDWDSPSDIFNAVVVQMTGPVSPGQTVPPRGAFKTITRGTVFSGFNTVDLTTNYRRIFGNVKVGQRVWMRCRTVSIGTGFASDWQVFTVLVS